MSTSDIERGVTSRNVTSRNGQHRTDAPHANGNQSPGAAAAMESLSAVTTRPAVLTLQAWHESAPEKIKRPAVDGDRDAVWQAWTKHLRRRKSSVAVCELLLCESATFLTWGLSDGCIDATTRSTIAALGQKKFNRSDSTADQSMAVARSPATLDAGQNADPSSSNLDFAIQSLAYAHALPRLADAMDQHEWWQLLESLVQTVHGAAAISLDQQPLVHQLLAGELAITLAYLFPEITACRELLPSAQRALSAGIDELLDGEGMPHRRHLMWQQPLVGCWTRCHAMGAALCEDNKVDEDDSHGCWSRDAEAQYPLAVREVLRLARRDGRPPFSTGACDTDANPVETIEQSLNTRSRHFLKLLVRQANDPLVDAIWASTLGDSVRRQKHAAVPALLPGVHSEWAQVALLRADWRQNSPRMVVQYGDQQVRTELSIGRDMLLSGNWEHTATVDGRTAEPCGDWEEVCWVSDEDVDYLEIELDLTEGLRIQRQICLARNDRFLFIADALLGTEPRKLEYRLRLPFGPGVSTQSIGETRELTIAGHKPRGLILPLALPEWRSDTRGGSLTADNAGLQIHQHIVGSSLFVPLWIDLDPKRAQQPFTWRQLHVAQQRQNVTRDVAAGYRVQFGKSQWLIYRALGNAVNRTVLGHNLATDFLIAKFARTGDVTTLVEVE